MPFHSNRVDRPCQVCGGRVVTPLFDNVLAPLDGLDMSYVLSKCQLCGFCFASHLPVDSQYVEYYSRLSKYDFQPKASHVDRGRIDQAVQLCLDFGFSKNIHVVDLGCGSGAFLASLRDVGFFNLQGIDPGPKSSVQARQHFKLDVVRQGGFWNAGEIVDLRRADLVCMMAVLEHLPNLRRDLGHIIDQMRSGAFVLIEVPALEFFDGNLGEPYGEMSIEHIQFFSSRSINNLLKGLGVEVLQEVFYPISDLYSGSLFVFGRICGSSSDQIEFDFSEKMETYLKASFSRWDGVIKQVPRQPFVIYGAGSHTARLLPKLDCVQRKNLISVLDGNENLQNKRMDAWLVEPPSALVKYTDNQIVISSHKSEALLLNILSSRFPGASIKGLYDLV